MVVILFGPPAAGKGTQGKNITDYFGLTHISTGEILRKNIKEKTPLGLIADGFISRGNLVPDELIISLVKDKIAKAGKDKDILLDGFPRTIVQTQQLDEFCPPDKVVDINVNTDVLIKRVTGRRVCPICGKNYHVSTFDSEYCTCGGKLFIRDDDTTETFKNRLLNYERLTAPIKDYYKSQGKLVSIDGEGKIEEVFERIKEALKID